MSHVIRQTALLHGTNGQRRRVISVIMAPSDKTRLTWCLHEVVSVKVARFVSVFTFHYGDQLLFLSPLWSTSMRRTWSIAVISYVGFVVNVVMTQQAVRTQVVNLFNCVYTNDWFRQVLFTCDICHRNTIVCICVCASLCLCLCPPLCNSAVTATDLVIYSSANNVPSS